MAYDTIADIKFEGIHFRRDIGHKALSLPLRVGVLGSTRGTDFQSIIDASEQGHLEGVKLAVCISDKENSGILEKARQHDIDAVHIPFAKGLSRATHDAKVTAVLESACVDLVLMIGYMRILSKDFTDRWARRCLNVHPSLLPAFAGGMDTSVHEAVLEAKCSETGCTVHYVTDEVDGGEILCQKKCRVDGDDTTESLKHKVQHLEADALVECILDFRNKRAIPCDHPQALTYKAAGVDINAGESLVQRIKPFCKATMRIGCDAGLGGFGGIFDIAAAGYGVPAPDGNDTLLVSGADGVGTKLVLAQSTGKHSTVGVDLVAMNVNDILSCGAEPLFFLDYYACGKLNVPEAAAVVQGIAEGCLQSNAVLIGGETAEMAGMYPDGEYDLAGFAVGAVRRFDLLPQRIGEGDILIGLPSSGVHSNGYSLVRKCVVKAGLNWSDPAPFQNDSTLADSLLTPTKIYVRALLPLIKQRVIKGIAHITGGGLLDNIPRILPKGTDAKIVVQETEWVLPPVFKWLQSIARLSKEELLRTFNCGIGMVLVVGRGDVEAVDAHLKSEGEIYFILGKIVKNSGTKSKVIVEGNLN
jgi:phosphoribosylamine--glycine ligase/phosphoribosylglycinamide formyltransferase/phosphoribosylformylglycinamidine cyclo-ligase/phosphoribosylamine--glycine ligase/phosphoribosylformylglycinamidine cyclo-ligase